MNTANTNTTLSTFSTFIIVNGQANVVALRSDNDGNFHIGKITSEALRTPDDVRHAFKRNSMVIHPDVCPSHLGDLLKLVNLPDDQWEEFVADLFRK